MRIRAKHLVWLVVATSVGTWIVVSLRPTPVLVDAGVVHRGSVAMTVIDDGRTRVREPYVVHAPIRGRLLRTDLRAGDAVHADQTEVGVIEPMESDLLDERTRAEAEADLSRARAVVEQTRALSSQAAAESEFAESERRRIADLVKTGIAATKEFESAERDAQSKRDAFAAAKSAVQIAERAVDVAAARALEPARNGAGGQREEHDEAARRVTILAPIEGVVLRVYERSERPIESGAAFMELGDPRAIEVVADLLSQDAVKVRAGMRAKVTDFGGENAEGRKLELEAVVRRVEPSGVTKISALGVEEQRVDVVLDPSGDIGPWLALGDGYRVDVHIETWRGDDLLVVPAGALFGAGEGHAVYVIDQDGFARTRKVRVGRRNGLDAEVLDGLVVGDRVVLHPSALVRDGAPVRVR